MSTAGQIEPLPPTSLLQDGCTASHLAARNGHLETLRILLAAGADPAAANKVRRDVMEVLLCNVSRS